MGISTSQLYLVTSYEVAKDAWDALRNHYERETLANKLFLKKRYFRTEMQEGTSVEEHLKYMKDLTDKLAAIGAPISDEDQVVTLLGSLPPKYSTLVTALEARVDDVTLSFVQQALVHEEQKQRGYSMSSMDGTSALVGEHKPLRGFRCFGCGETGHFRRDCPKRKPNNPHKAKAAEEQERNYDYSQAFQATTAADGTNKWVVIDSGASSHMTKSKELLIDYEVFQAPEKSWPGRWHVG